MSDITAQVPEYVSKFTGSTKLTAGELVEVFNRFDKDGKRKDTEILTVNLIKVQISFHYYLELYTAKERMEFKPFWKFFFHVL